MASTQLHGNSTTSQSIGGKKECECDLFLGVSGSLADTTNPDKEDPLVHKLADFDLSYADPCSKEEVTRPIMNILTMKVKELYLDGKGKEPVITIPPEDIPSAIFGFPNTSAASGDKELSVKKKNFAKGYSESLVYSRFTQTLYKIGEPALVLLNYKPDSYLNELRNRAKEEQSGRNWLRCPLGEKEKHWAKILGLDLDNHDGKHLIQAVLQQNSKRKLLLKINKNKDSNFVKKLKTKLLNKNLAEKLPHSSTEKENLIQNLLYAAGLDDTSEEEFDILIVFPTSHRIIDIEVKSTDAESENTGKDIQNAAQQTARRNKLFQKLHQDILSSEWTYIRAVALPLVSSLKDIPSLKICTRCREYILDRGQLNSSLEAWMTTTRQQGHQASSTMDQFRNLLTRIVGFLLISDTQHLNKFGDLETIGNLSKLSLAKQQMAGRELHHQAVVGTEASDISSEPPSSEDINIWDRHQEEKDPTHLGSLRTVFLWNRDQLNVMQLDRKRVIFDADFGTGKTLMLKSRALHLAKGLMEGQKVVFASFARLNSRQSSSSAFDLETIDEFKDRQVTFLSYKFEGGKFPLQSLVDNHPKAHFFMDEVPAEWVSEREYMSYLNIIEPTFYIWIALTRLTDQEQNLTKEEIQFLEEEPFNFYLPVMKENMRNCSRVVELADKLCTMVHLAGSKTLLPQNTILGVIPKIIPFSGKTPDELEKATVHAVQNFDTEESILILVDVQSLVASIYLYFPKRIENACLSLRDGRKITTCIEDDSSSAQMNEYLQDKQGILITAVDSFHGSQAKNTILVPNFNSSLSIASKHTYLRNNILRCTTSCVLLINIDTDEGRRVIKRCQEEDTITCKMEDLFSHMAHDTDPEKTSKRPCQAQHM